MTDPNTPPLLSALSGRGAPRTPVWLMRQAGRYLPEYREVRARVGGFLDMVRDPEVATEITLQPVRRFGMDGAIIFSDILLPLEAMGMELRFEDGVGPVFPAPLRTAADIDGLRPVEPAESLGYVGEALSLTAEALADDVTLLGFCGAPFTLACYAVEGVGGRRQVQLRRMMYHQPELYRRLMTRLADVVADHLRYQVACGARAVVLFDTWAGALSRADYLTHVRPFTERALRPLAGVAPRMAFVLGGSHVLDDLVDLGVEAVAIDWRTPLGATLARHGDRVAVQGNLDPLALLATPDEVARRTKALLEEAAGHPAHVMSLGHGIQKETDPECVAALVETVRAAAPLAAGSRGDA